jgi:hypothetical protein
MENNKLPFEVHLSLNRIAKLVKAGSLSAEYCIGYREGIEKLYDHYEALQAKCDRYEDALKDVKGYTIQCLKHLSGPDHKIILERIDRALSAGEDRVCPNCNKAFNADRHGNCRECGSDEYVNQKEDKQ